MNFAASGPTTSILPSVEASNNPAALRTVTHSRLTAACISSPALGKYQARFHWPTSSNTAPCASAQGWIAVRRVGSNSGPRAWLTIAPKVTGVKRGRKVVSPTSGMSLPSASAAMANPCKLEVLPWSVAMPFVVKRLTCSIERMPSFTAWRMSLAVTSFWKSTKAFTVVSGAAPGA